MHCLSFVYIAQAFSIQFPKQFEIQGIKSSMKLLHIIVILKIFL